MSTWLPRIRIAFPESLLDTANRLAQLTDPDVGGAFTFDASRTLTVGGSEYVFADIPFMEHFWPIVESRDPVIWHQAMAGLAAEKVLDPIAQEDIDALCAGCLIGDECEESSE